MSTSPPNYDFEGDPLLEAYMNAKFSEEISEKMKVPKRRKSINFFSLIKCQYLKLFLCVNLILN